MATRYTYDGLRVNRAVPAGVSVNNVPCYRFQVNGKDCIHRFDSTVIQKTVNADIVVELVSTLSNFSLKVEWDDDDIITIRGDMYCEMWIKGESSDSTLSVTGLKAQQNLTFGKHKFCNKDIFIAESLGLQQTDTWSKSDYTYNPDLSPIGLSLGSLQMHRTFFSTILSNGATSGFVDNGVGSSWPIVAGAAISVVKNKSLNYGTYSLADALRLGYIELENISLGGSIESWSLSPDGNKLTCITRGKIISTTINTSVPGPETQIY